MGQQRPRDPPDLLPPPAEGRQSRGPAHRGRPAPDVVRRMGRPVARPRRRQRHRPGQRDGPRDHPGRAPAPGVHRQRHHWLRGVPGERRAVHPRLRRARDRHPGGGDPRGRARLRHRRPGDDLLDARDHRAPQRRRQRPGTDQPRAAHRARRAVRLRAQPAAWPEQRPGRRRHGRAAGSAARLPARRERRAAGQVRCDLGRAGPAEAWLAPVRDVRRDGARRAPGALRDRREPGPVRGRPEAGTAPAEHARLHGRPGHLPDRDRRAGRRRPPGGRGVGRERGHRHELRTAGPARAQGARPAGRGAGRPGDHLRPRPGDGPGLGCAVGRGRLERAANPLAGPCRDELRPARGRRRPPVAVLRRDAPRRAVPPLAPLGRAGPGQPGPVRAGRARSTGRQARRRLPDPADDRSPARLVQHGCPERGLYVAVASGRVARHLARGCPGVRARGRRAGPGRVAPRAGSRCRSGSTRRSDRA